MPDVVDTGQEVHKNIALAWWNAGISVVPIQPNGTKRPTRDWSILQRARLTKSEVDYYWREGQDCGVALICGAVSGHLEMTELEAAASTSAALRKIEDECDQRGIRDLWDSLLFEGYAESTPSGGLHFLYRVSDHNIPGNTKLAQVPDPDNNNILKTLAETRGEGGYVIVAPSSGKCHPTGDDWSTVAGNQGIVPEISWSERVALHAAITAALDETPAPEPIVQRPSTDLVVHTDDAVDERPGDEFNRRASWEDDWFTGQGWTISHRMGTETFWVRPGKDRRDGHSASTGYRGDKDNLYVWSTSAGLPVEVPLSKFFVYATYHFHGDLSLAAKVLHARGMGGTGTKVKALQPWDPDIPSESEVSLPAHAGIDFSDVGSGRRMKDRYGDQFRYNTREKVWYRWTGVAWVKDEHKYIDRAAVHCAEAMVSQALVDLAEAENNLDPDVLKAARRRHSHAVGLLNIGKLDAAIKAFASEPGISITSDQFNTNPDLLNLPNGVLDLSSNTFHAEHNSSDLMTLTMGTEYDKDAQCPQFERFMEDAFSDPELRSYVQRALGYSLTGRPDERVMFLLHGPSGTGKSVLTNVMNRVFGDYAVTAPASTFRVKKNTDTLDLHRLRGARFVTTSEMPEGQQLDEDLMKRLTGGDKVTSRGHYEAFSEWRPNCVVWIATNFLPRVNSDDNAIWNRAKTINMTTEFVKNGQQILGYDRVLAHESSGILNWLIQGLVDYQLYGLAEPECVRADVEAYRTDVDSVASFIRDKMEDGILVLDGDGQIKSSTLRELFKNYCSESSQPILGPRRYQNRLKALGFESVKVGGQAHWRGLRQDMAYGALGTLL
jgi:putative DNA primase/helicase